MKINALFIALVSILLSSFAVVWAQSDPGDQLIGSRLASLSASSGGKPTDCGTTPLNRPDANVTTCAQTSFENHKPFHILYESTLGLFKYGLAGDIKRESL